MAIDPKSSDGTDEPLSPKKKVVTFAEPPPPEKLCCPKFCFTYNWQTFNSTFTCLALIASAGTFIGLMSTMVRPHLRALTFVNGTCTTVNATFTGQRESCACGKKTCFSTYPCLALLVTYQGRDGQTITSMLHEEEHVFTYVPHCSYQPKHCSDGYNGHALNKFYNTYAVPGTKFRCFHNPNGQGAVRVRTRDLSFVVHAIFWPLFFTVLFTILCLVLYCYCCGITVE